MEYVASFSGGKDSTALILKLIEKRMPMTKVVNYDTGMEFQAVYSNIKKIEKLIKDYGAELIVLKPETDFLMDMLIRPVNVGTEKEHYGYDWCGGCTRWRTSGKVQTINKYLQSIGDYKQYIGIASDEQQRIRQESNKLYPLYEWSMTEKDCLEYCYSCGYDWKENNIELYSILDRVSCWCCGNKNIKELRNMYHYLPHYWNLLKGMQSRISRPFHGKYTVFDLEKRFQQEDMQLTIFDFMASEE